MDKEGTLKEFFEKYPTFSFDTIYEKGEYEIVAVIKTHILKETEEGFRYYRFHEYNDESEFNELANFLNENKIYETETEIEYGDKIVILSTCEYSVEQGRLLIVGKKKIL